ncbi:MAG: hypothetical protein WD751_08860 [Anaerolineales bacterium]
MKKEWLYYIPVIAYVVVWGGIFYASAQAGCSDNDPIAGLQGLCLARWIAGMSCFAIYLAVWTFLGAQVAMGKGRNPIMGAILGLTLQFMGCIGLMMMEPRRDHSGRMIGWDEYKHYTPEQREAIRPVKVPDTPDVKRRKKIVIGIAIAVAVMMVLQVLKNLGKF